MVNDFWNNPDLCIISGSQLYGCSTPESDEDLRGMVIEPGEYLIGRKKFDQYSPEDDDTVIWGIRKFFALLEKGSPNCSEILFAPKENIRTCTDAGQKILDNKDIFVSRKWTDAIRGFASSKWMAAQLLHKNKETGEVKRSLRVIGARRKESYEQHGYSTKNAYHAIRLLDQGIELLRSGTITFPRPNTDELFTIRNGEIPFAELEKRREALAEEFSQAELETSLPGATDRSQIDQLYLELISPRLMEMIHSHNVI